MRVISRVTIEELKMIKKSGIYGVTIQIRTDKDMAVKQFLNLDDAAEWLYAMKIAREEMLANEGGANGGVRV